MAHINFKRTLNKNVDDVVKDITPALQKIGFGILTRIDFDQKISEKLGKEIPKTVILGACNPALAFEAYKMNSDFTSLLPCNVVVRDLGGGQTSLEIAKPTAMLEALGDKNMVNLAREADIALEKALNSI